MPILQAMAPCAKKAVWLRETKKQLHKISITCKLLITRIARVKIRAEHLQYYELSTYSNKTVAHLNRTVNNNFISLYLVLPPIYIYILVAISTRERLLVLQAWRLDIISLKQLANG